MSPANSAKRRMESCVLVVADDLGERARIARALYVAGHIVELAEDAKRAVRLAADRKVETAIVAMGRGRASLAIARQLRDAVRKMLVLVDPTDEVTRSDLSFFPVEAILLRPLAEQQLLTRLEEFKKSLPAPVQNQQPEAYCFEGCRFDLAGRVFVDASGGETPLTRSEAAVLTLFVRNPRRVLSRDLLRRTIAGHGVDAYDRSVDVLVGRLRRKIEPDSKAARFILTVSGAGYKFAVRPHSVESNEVLQPFVPGAESERKFRGRLENVESPHPDDVDVARLPEPEYRQVTVMCCGLVAATAIAGELDLEEVRDAINNFQRGVTIAVARMGGSIVRSSSEDILAVFGYPRAHEDDAERSVQAALDALASDLQSPAGQALGMQTVIATGLVLVGEGQELIGEPRTIVTSLRVTAPQNSVLITAATREIVLGKFDLEGPTLHEFKGVPGPVTTYRVMGRRSTRTRFEARRKQNLTRFVGRQNELRQLLELWSHAKAGAGQTAVICGEPGIGKSRIFEALLERIRYEPHITIRCQCSWHHINSPFHPIVAHLSHAAGFDRSDTPEKKLQKLELALSRAGSVISEDVALCAAMLSIQLENNAVSQELTPQRQKELTISALVRQVLSLARKQTLILKLADAHWVDSSTLELFGRIIGSIATAPMFILVSCRPEFFVPWLEHSNVSILRLDRMEHGQARDMIADIAGDKLSDQICEHIVKRTDGVPLFLEELTKTIVESRLDDGNAGHSVSFGQTAIPVTLAASLAARLDKLGRAKEIAQMGSAIGREFSYSLLAAVASMSSVSLRSALVQFAVSGLIFVRGDPPDATYIFKHALVQDAAYATLPSSKKRRLHAAIAHALEQKFPETIETQPELIAHHFLHAELGEQAVEYLRKAGQRAIQQSANAEAIGHLTRALELLGSFPDSPARHQSMLRLRAILAQAMIAMRGYAAPQTKEALLLAKGLIDGPTYSSEKFVILYGMWAASYVGGVSSEQRSAAHDLSVEAQRRDDPAALCIAHRALGTSSLAGGDFEVALQHLEQARALHDPKYHSDLRHQYGQDIGAAALCYLSWALWHLGFVDQATRIADAAARRAEDVAHPHTLVYTICHARGFMNIFGRRSDGLQYWADQVVVQCAEHGFSHWMNCGRIFQGWAAVCGGDVDNGIQILAAGIAAWRATGARLWLPTFLTLEAEANAKIGRNEAALQSIEQALAVSRETGETWAMAEVLRIKAQLLFELDKTRVDKVEALLISSLSIARRQHARCYELRAARDLMRIRQGQDGGDYAISQLRPVYEQFSEGFDTADLQEVAALIRKLKADI
jgi:DNA-binding response OmpR family regulator/class 3 adenylate cyclase/predicted ATPase